MSARAQMAAARSAGTARGSALTDHISSRVRPRRRERLPGRFGGAHREAHPSRPCDEFQLMRVEIRRFRERGVIEAMASAVGLIGENADRGPSWP